MILNYCLIMLHSGLRELLVSCDCHNFYSTILSDMQLSSVVFTPMSTRIHIYHSLVELIQSTIIHQVKACSKGRKIKVCSEGRKIPIA